MKKTYVYKITRSDQKSYIGTTTNVKKRFKDHSLTERFKHFDLQFEILKEFDNYEEALNFEELMIEKFDTFYNGLNLSKNGRGNHLCKNFTTYGLKFSEETKKKIGESSKNRNAINKALKKISNYSDEEKKQFYKKIEEKKNQIFLKRGFKQRKFDSEIIKNFLYEFKNFKLQDCNLKFRKNGKHVTAERIFCEYFGKKNNLNPTYLYKILKGKVKSWNIILEEILDLKF